MKCKHYKIHNMRSQTCQPKSGAMREIWFWGNWCINNSTVYIKLWKLGQKSHAFSFFLWSDCVILTPNAWGMCVPGWAEWLTRELCTMRILFHSEKGAVEAWSLSEMDSLKKLLFVDWELKCLIRGWLRRSPWIRRKFTYGLLTTYFEIAKRVSLVAKLDFFFLSQLDYIYTVYNGYDCTAKANVLKLYNISRFLLQFSYGQVTVYLMTTYQVIVWRIFSEWFYIMVRPANPRVGQCVRFCFGAIDVSMIAYIKF